MVFLVLEPGSVTRGDLSRCAYMSRSGGRTVYTRVVQGDGVQDGVYHQGVQEGSTRRRVLPVLHGFRKRMERRLLLVLPVFNVI